MTARTSLAALGFWVLFAGGGGSSRGIVEAGHKVEAAINHNPTALAVHAANHPDTEHLVTTVTTKARLGIVMVHGTPYQIVDITFRMLEPHELLRAQCGEYADDYDISAARTKAAKIELVGNMVCPHPARALVAANVPTEEARAA